MVIIAALSAETNFIVAGVGEGDGKPVGTGPRCHNGDVSGVILITFEAELYKKNILRNTFITVNVTQCAIWKILICTYLLQPCLKGEGKVIISDIMFADKDCIIFKNPNNAV